jgi:hypothetical protein
MAATATADPRTDELAVNDLVRLAEFVGSKTQQGLTWRVTAINPPTGRRAFGTYSIVPTIGGKGLRAERDMLLKTNESGAVVQVIEFDPSEGQTLVVKDEHLRRIPGYTKGDVLVVLAVKPGAVKAALLNRGTGRYWPSLPLTALRPTTKQELVEYVTS